LDKKTPTHMAAAIETIQRGVDTSSVRAAIMDLGYAVGPEVYSILVRQLDDPNPAIQHAAVISLGRLGRPEAIEELIKPKVFRSPHGNIRWAVVSAIGKLGDFRVIDDLLRAVEDSEWIVRTQAVTELIGKVREVITRKDIRLARILVHMMCLENEEIVNLAIQGFQEFGLESLGLLHEALNNSSATIRANAARALGRLKSHLSTPYLLGLLEDEEGAVRANAAEALGLIQNKISIEPLILRIQDNIEKVQNAAVEAIVRFENLATVPLLNALSREREKFSQRAVIKCLGRIGDPKAIPALIGYLRSSYYLVRQAAVTALARFGPRVVQLLVATLSFNKSDIEHFKKDALDKYHPELQLRAIKALGGLEDHRAVSLLKDLVDKSLPDVQDAAGQALSQIGCAAWGRCCALRVLGEVGDASLIPRIAPSLQDHADNVRFEAVRAVGRLGGGEAAKLLQRTLRTDRCDYVRAEAVRLLRSIGPQYCEDLSPILHALKDRDREVKIQAAGLLGNCQDEKSILPLLKTRADAHWSVRESAENALMNFGRQIADPLIGALGSRSWTMRFRAARLLGKIGDPKATVPLKNVIARRGERKDVREIAEASLRKLEPTQPPS
jgi:HEAT repeat protein